MISFREKGDLRRVTNYLNRIKNGDQFTHLEQYAQAGLNALAAATPIDTGRTATSWSYEIKQERDSVVITYHNHNIQNGVPIAIILQYGHGTGTGGWVQGRDYINPAIQPIFDKIANEAWREVTRA